MTKFERQREISCSWCDSYNRVTALVTNWLLTKFTIRINCRKSWLSDYNILEVPRLKSRPKIPATFLGKWGGYFVIFLGSSRKILEYPHTWSYNKVRELIAVKVLNTSLMNTTVVPFKVVPLGSYVPMPAPSPPFKTILELVSWNGLQNCRCINPDVINVIKMPSFQYFLYLREQKKVTGG